MFETKCSSQKTVPQKCLCRDVSNVKRYKMNKQPACFQHPPRDADAQQAGTDAPDNSHLVSGDHPTTSEYVCSVWHNWGPQPRSSSLAGEFLPRAGDKINWSRACGTVQRVSLQHSQVSVKHLQVSHWFVGRVCTADIRWKQISEVQKIFQFGWLHTPVYFPCLNHAKSLLKWCRQTLSKLKQSWAGKGGSLDNTPLTPDVQAGIQCFKSCMSCINHCKPKMCPYLILRSIEQLFFFFTDMALQSRFTLT